MRPFRKENQIPCRTCTKTYSNYKRYKDALVADFKGRCGYTNTPHAWLGGKNAFHIDHFKPWKKFPHLKNVYDNLVYCCSYVNILKSDDEIGYIDPCKEDYNEHFQRTEKGEIVPISQEAEYMYDKLKLYLPRYHIIWMLEELLEKIETLEYYKSKTKDYENLQEINNLLAEYAIFLSRYITYWECVQ